MIGERHKRPRPVGLIASVACFLFFLLLAMASGYGGFVFFGIGAVGSPMIGALASLLAHMQYRPIVTFALTVAAVLAMSVIGVVVFQLGFL